MSLSRSHRRVCSTLLDNLVCTARVSLRTRRLCWGTEKCTCRVYCRRSRHDGAATRSRKGVGVYSTLSHSPRTLHHSVPCSQQQQQQQQQQRAGALTLSSSCLDGSVTPVGPGQNPQYTGAPKEGGGCGLLDKSTTTSPMAQPQYSKKQCINVNNRFSSSCCAEDRVDPQIQYQQCRRFRRPKRFHKCGSWTRLSR